MESVQQHTWEAGQSQPRLVDGAGNQKDTRRERNGESGDLQSPRHKEALSEN